MGVRLHSRLDRPCRSLIKLAEPHISHRLASKHAEHQRIEGAQKARVVGGLDSGKRIARLRMDESESVVAEREIRTKVDGLLQLADRFVVPAGEPEAVSSLGLHLRKVVTFQELGALPFNMIVQGLIVGASLMLGTFVAKEIVEAIL